MPLQASVAYVFALYVGMGRRLQTTPHPHMLTRLIKHD